MKKAELVTEVAEIHGLSKAQTNRVLSTLVEKISEQVAAGERVAIPGLGAFTRGTRNARTTTTPQGEEVSTPAHHCVKFSPAKQFKDQVKAVPIKKRK